MISRLDHMIICARDRHWWAERIGRVLGLEPSRGRVGDVRGFDNWEFNIGDGFIGVVSPSTADSQLERFLSKRGDGFYAVSVDIGSLERASARFEEVNVPYTVTKRNGVPALLWPSPQRATAGVLFQVIGGILPAQGTNQQLVGLRRAVLAADDLDERVRQLRTAFSLPPPTVRSDRDLVARTAVFELAGSKLHQELVLAAPLKRGSPLARQLQVSGPSIFEWGIATSALDGELARLERLGIGCELSHGSEESSALIDPAELGGLRFRLHPVRSQ